MSTSAYPISSRYVSDRRMLLILGRALALQVGHPVVAAGITEHSTFRVDPWARFQHSLDALLAATCGPNPEITAAAIRQLHRGVNGVDSAGVRYHALQPEAYFWVLATTLESVIVMGDLFARPMSGRDRECFYEEWRQLGLLLGLRDRDMPDGWKAFRHYYDDMLESTVEDNEVVHQVIDLAARPSPPPGLPAPAVWRVFGPATGQLLNLTTVGTLPVDIRTRWGVPWSESQQVALRALSRALRLADLLPSTFTHFRSPDQPWRPPGQQHADNSAAQGRRHVH